MDCFLLIPDNTNIYTLSQLTVHGTPCHMTVQLCTCVALMVSIAFPFSLSLKQDP